eukprot:193522-Chlamydomonas_euryale.AAC.3
MARRCAEVQQCVLRCAGWVGKPPHLPPRLLCTQSYAESESELQGADPRRVCLCRIMPCMPSARVVCLRGAPLR